jgi:hypothetical protein
MSPFSICAGLVPLVLAGCATPEPAVVKTVQVGSVFNCTIYLTYIEDTSIKRYWEKCDER